MASLLIPNGTLRRAASVLAASTLLVAACGPSGGAAPAAPTSASQAATATATPSGGNLLSQPTASASASAVPAATLAPSSAGKPGGRVILGEFGDAKTLNPVTVTDVTSDVVTSRIYASLTRVDAKTGDTIPGLAEKLEASPDGTSLRFTLRNGLKWSDGSPLTGDDFKFTVMATLRSKKTNHKNNVDQIKGAQEYISGAAEDLSGITVSGNDITVSLQNSFCPAMNQIGNLSIIPKSVFGKYLDPKDPTKNLDDAPENLAPPLASGAFKFKEWQPNDHITLVRNDMYWQKANIDEWVMKVYPSQDAQTAAVKVGEIDMTEIAPKDLKDMQSTSAVQVFKYLNLGYTYMSYNQMRGGKEFLRDKAVRQAMTYAINMDLIIEKVMFGEGVKMVAHTPPVSWAYDASDLNTYPFDPAKAEQLLQGAGYAKGSDGIYAKAGQKLEFSVITNSGNKTRETFIQVASEQLKAIGISVEPKTESFEALVDRLNTSKDPVLGDEGGHDFDSIVLGWSLTADPDMYSVWHSNSTHPSENNAIIYKNPALDQAIIAGRTKCSQAERKAAYKTANKILNEEQPYNFGFAQNVLLVVNKRIQGIDPGPFVRRGQVNPETWTVQ